MALTATDRCVCGHALGEGFSCRDGSVLFWCENCGRQTIRSDHYGETHTQCLAPKILSKLPPTCPNCHERMYAGRSDPNVTYYYCPTPDCRFSEKRARKREEADE